MKAAVFDMDGVLVDSEPLWREAEIETFRTVDVHLTDEMCHDTLGLRLEEAVRHWYARYPWAGKSVDDVGSELESKMLELIDERARPMPGVYTLLRTLRDCGLRIGLATSSSHPVIDAVMRKLDIGSFFDVRCSATDERRGKPDPAVYLTAARGLNVAPAECIAFEDSVSGVRSAKSAGMYVVAVPADHCHDDQGFTLADLKLRSLAQFSIDRDRWRNLIAGR